MLIQFLFKCYFRSDKSPIPAKRIVNIIDYLSFASFYYTARGLYEEHKFLFTLLLAIKIDLQAGKISMSEFDVLIKGLFQEKVFISVVNFKEFDFRCT